MRAVSPLLALLVLAPAPALADDRAGPEMVGPVLPASLAPEGSNYWVVGIAAETFGQEVGGTGLGLAIVKSIVERHGGTVAVVSKLGEGSSFSLTLPACDNEDTRLAEGGPDDNQGAGS